MEPRTCEFWGDTKYILVQACDCRNLGFIIIRDGHILTEDFITLSQTFHPAKGWFDWAKIGAVRRKVYNFFATRHLLVNCRNGSGCTVPCFNQGLDVLPFMNTTILHHNDRFTLRKIVHLHEKPLDEVGE